MGHRVLSATISIPQSHPHTSAKPPASGGETLACATPGSGGQSEIEAHGAQQAVSPRHYQRHSALLRIEFELDQCAINGASRGGAGAVEQQAAAAAQERCRTHALSSIVGCRAAAEALHTCSSVEHVRQPYTRTSNLDKTTSVTCSAIADL